MGFQNNVFVFVFSSMILAVVLELWAIGTFLKRISDTLKEMSDKMNGERKP